MRIAATLLLLLTALSGVVLLLGGVTMICGFLGELSSKQFGQLLSGELYVIIFSDTFWTRCLQPDLPRPSWFLDWMAAGLVFPLMVAVWLGVRRRLKHPCVAMGAVCLLLGIVPYAVGAVMVRDTSSPSEVGPWLALMLIGPLYACSASVVFSGSALFADIWPDSADTIKRMVVRRRHAMRLSIGRN